jgi:hypothetical protein
MAKPWAEMTVEEKLELLLYNKANLQNIRTLAALVDEIGAAVKKLEKEVSELRQTHNPPTNPGE